MTTYRIQLNRDYPFRKLKNDIEYFSLLGVGTIYASPVFAAVPGSMHGYDVIDPLKLNPEIGHWDELVELISRLRSENIGWLQDIVPNHMAFHSSNEWLMDVLEKGPFSNFDDIFDIDRDHPRFNGKLMVPFLGAAPEELIQRGELQLDWHQGTFVFRYYAHIFPVNFESFFLLITEGPVQLQTKIRNHLSGIRPPKAIADRDFLYKTWPKVKTDLEQAWQDEPDFRSLIQEHLNKLNSTPSQLAELLRKQYYELCFWRDSETAINYRRFFTINQLISLQMRKKEVFDLYHRLIAKLLSSKLIDGLRVDHIDGLNQPSRYLTRLRRLPGEDAFLVVEKILAKEEELPPQWPVQGTTGYDFLSLVNNLFTYSPNYPRLLEFYQTITGRDETPEKIIYRKKKFILTRRLAAELDNLHRMFENSGFFNPQREKSTAENRKEALLEFLLACPVYCLYSSQVPLSAEDQQTVARMINDAKDRAPQLAKELRLIGDVLLRPDALYKEQKEKAAYFFMRCMQYTGPLMAKGVEDTTMYDYNCFVAHSEVGDSPGAKGISVSQFHEAMLNRRKDWPLTMNTTSTHDTKRGEDVRARLNVLSELADEWMTLVCRWIVQNRTFKSTANQLRAPSVNEEYFIYQNLLGIFPVDGNITDALKARLHRYLIKALREAKKHTDWIAPDEAYEKAVVDFASRILEKDSPFLQSFISFQRKVADYGRINSLSQLTLKCTCPGIPDIYQGTEFWDLSLVDPDNRRSVDFEKRLSALKEMMEAYRKNSGSFYENLSRDKAYDSLKLWLTYLLLNERKRNPELFVGGEYIPLQVQGKYKNHVLAFARKLHSDWFVVAIPVHFAVLAEAARQRLENFNWEDTVVLLPEGVDHLQLINVLDGAEIIADGEIPLFRFWSESKVILLKTIRI